MAHKTDEFGKYNRRVDVNDAYDIEEHEQYVEQTKPVNNFAKTPSVEEMMDKPDIYGGYDDYDEIVDSTLYGSVEDAPEKEVDKDDDGLRKTMSGMQQGVYLERIEPVAYRDKAGNQKYAIDITPRKRADIEDQASVFDGGYVVNRFEGKEIKHTQRISFESAQRIFELNGVTGFTADVMESAARKLGEKHQPMNHANLNLAQPDKGPMRFDANIFQPKNSRYGDYRINPKVEKLNASEEPFNVKKNQYYVKLREQEHAENKRKYDDRKDNKKDNDKGDDLEP